MIENTYANIPPIAKLRLSKLPEISAPNMVVIWVVLLGIWKISTVEITNAIVNKTPNNYFFIEVFLSLITAMTATRPIKAGNPKANKFKRLN